MTPQWLIDLIATEMRQLHSSPESVAKAVWEELPRKVMIEYKEQLDLSMKAAGDQMIASASGAFRIREVPKFCMSCGHYTDRHRNLAGEFRTAGCECCGRLVTKATSG